MEHHWRTEKIITLAQAKELAEKLRAEGKKIVTVNGVFDLLHAGHLDLLEEAKQQGDVLIVAINSDTSVREKKGLTRPYIPEQERAAVLAALACVDYVIIIDAPYDGGVTKALLQTVRPAIHTNGSEYGEPETWIEWPDMQAVGAQGYIVQRRPGLATTDIVKRIQETL
jgi:rfaE bifunctional protein nucleotidyltransferase chain/domain